MFNNGGHCLLADEMGLGKTLQVLTLIAHCAELDQSSMIVCPASVVPVWKMEIERWYPNLRVEILKSDHLPKREKGVLWLSSYSLLRRHVDQVKSVTFEYLILDEAQCIKNPLAKVSQACYSLDGKFRLAITGTPIENKLLDIWSIFNFLMPGLMGSMQEFEAALQSGNASWVSEFSDHVKKQISPFILRRLKERVAQELPAKTEVDLICPIKGQQKTLYNAFLNKELALINDESGKVIEQKGFSLFTLLTRLRQVCCDPGIIPDLDFDAEESGKVIVLLSRLYEAFDGIKKRKVVIFSQFVKLIDRLNPILKKHFPDLNIYELTGSTRDRSQPVREFQEDANSAIILVSLKAGGTGVTLNSADYLFLMDPWWNPAVENQAIDRVHRMGQKMPVFIYRMITKGTIEERIQLLKSEKREIFDATFKDVNLVKDIHEYFGNLTNLVALDNTESKETSAVKELIK
jgi:SNF2 family DNA or RNA helicase